MSEQSQGPGYWQASDGLWYPPEEHPDSQAQAKAARGAPEATAPAFDPTPAAEPLDWPAQLTVAPATDIARWRVVAHVFMAIPHLIVLWLISAISGVLVWLSWFIILFTGKLPEGLHNFQALRIRYGNRVTGFMIFLTEEYPPFEFEMTSPDTTGYPVQTAVEYDGEGRDRIKTLLRAFLAIPHFIALFFLALAAYVVYIIVWFAILLTGRVPDGNRRFLIGVGRWSTRVQAYALLLTDHYPPFSLD